jgi:hypothetical protein
VLVGTGWLAAVVAGSTTILGSVLIFFGPPRKRKLLAGFAALIVSGILALAVSQSGKSTTLPQKKLGTDIFSFSQEDDGPESDADQHRINELVVREAQKRLRRVQSETNREVGAANEQLQATVDSLAAIGAEQAEVAKESQDLSALLEAASEQQRPEHAFQNSLPRNRLGMAISRLSVARPEDFYAVMQSIRERVPLDGGSLDVRVAPLMAFATRLRELLAALQALQGRTDHDRASISLSDPKSLVDQLSGLSQSDWDLETLRSHLAVLDHVAGWVPMFEVADRPTLKAGLDRVLLSFNDGRLKTAVAASRDLLNSLMDPANTYAQESALTARERQIQYEIREVDLATSETGRTLQLSTSEQQAFSHKLAKGTSRWPLEQAERELHYRMASLGGGNPEQSQLKETLTQEFQALAAVSKFQRSLSDGAQWTDEKRDLLAHAFIVVEKAQMTARFLDGTRLDRDQLLASIPVSSKDFDPDALSSFQDFKKSKTKKDSNLWEQLLGANAEQRLLRLWYGQCVSEVSFAYWEHLHELLLAMMSLSENPRNLFVQIARQEAAARNEMAQASMLPELESGLREEQWRLENQKTNVEMRALAARNLAPDVSLANMRLTRQEISAISRSVQTVLSLKFRDNAKARQWQQSLVQLGTNLEAINKEQGVAGTPLDSDQQQELERSLAALSSHLLDLSSPDRLVQLGHGKHKEQSLLDLKEFQSDVLHLQARLSGLSKERIRQGMNGDEKSFEDQAVLAPLTRIPQTTEQSSLVRGFAQRKLRSASWLDPVFSVQVANEALVIASGGISRLAYGLAGTTAKALTKFPITGGGEEIEVKVAGSFATGLGGLNGVILGYGGAGELYKGTHGRLPAGTYRLDPKTFGHLDAKVGEKRSAAPKAGVIYMLSSDGGLLLEFDNSPITIAEARNSRRWRMDDRSRLVGGVFTVVDGHRFVWCGNHATPRERLKHLGNGVVGVLGATQIAQGLPHEIKDLSTGKSGLELVRLNNNPAYRFLDGAYLLGLVTNAKSIADSVRFKLISRHGGYMDAKAPKLISEINLTKSHSGPAKLLIDENGNFYAPRKDGNTVYLDRLDGTVIGKLTPSRGIRRFLNAIGLHSNFQAYIDSTDATKITLLNLNDPYGHFVPRRPGSAAVRYDAQTETLTIQEGMKESRYRLGKNVQVAIKGQPASIRPYYSLDDPLKGLRGAIIAPNEKITTRGDNAEIPNELILVYLYSLPESFRNWDALVNDGGPLELGSLEGEIARSEFLKSFESATVSGSMGHWDIYLQGTARYLDDSNLPLFTVSESEGGLTISDSRNPSAVSYVHLAQPKSGPDMEVSAISLSGLAKTAALDNSEGQWFRISSKPATVPHDARVFTPKDAPEARLFWEPQTLAWRVNVLAPGVTFPSPGSYLFQMGEKGIELDQAGLQDPFEWDQELPGLVPDFEREFNLATDSKETRLLSHGGLETRYWFHQVDPNGDSAPLTGTFVVRADHQGNVRAYRATNSLPRIIYRETANRSDEMTYWEPVFNLPRDDGDFAWFRGPPPDAITDHLRQYWKKPSLRIGAEYTWDPLTGRFFLKVTASAPGTSESSWLFQSPFSPAGSVRSARTESSNGQSYTPLPPGIPDELIMGLTSTLFDLQHFQKNARGRWEYRAPSRASLLALKKRLQNNSAIILNSGVSLQFLQKRFLDQGKKLVQGTAGASDTILYGGVRFTSNIVAGDPDSPAQNAELVILQAPDGGRFVDPQSGEITQLLPGQVLMVDLATGDRELALDRLRQQPSLPYLRRVLASMAGLANQKEIIQSSSRLDYLPHLLGQGAEAIQGRWIKQQIFIQGRPVWQYRYFQVAAPGGNFTEAVTGQEVVLEPESIWSLESPPLTATYAEFHKHHQPAWSVSLISSEMLNHDFRQMSARLGVPNEFVTDHGHNYSWKDPATRQTIVGHLLKPAKANPYAPAVLVVEQGGEIRDPLFGNVQVVAGDTLVLQSPLALRRDIEKELPESAIVLVDALRQSVTSIKAAEFASPAFSGIKKAQDLPSDARRNLPTTVSNETLIKAAKDGHFEGEVLLQPPLLRWLKRYQEGLGLVVMGTSQYDVMVNDQPRQLAGIIGIGTGPGALPLAWIESHQKSKLEPNGRRSWHLMIDRQDAGTVLYGRKSAQDHQEQALRPARALLAEALRGPPYQHEETLLYQAVERVKTYSNETYDQTLEHLMTHLRIRERRSGDRTLSRAYFSPNGATPFRVTYFGHDATAPFPLYSVGQDARVLERYRVKRTNGQLTIARYAPDGNSLLGLLCQDDEGQLLWQWNALNHTLEKNFFDEITLGGRHINRQQRHEAVTRSEMYRITPRSLGIETTSTVPVNPYTPSTSGLSPDAQRAPALAPASGLDPVTLNLADSSVVKHPLGMTVYDPRQGRQRPLYHVSSKGFIDEVYDVRVHKSPRKLRIFRLQPEDQWLQERWSMDQYPQLLDHAKHAVPMVETRVIDALGRMTTWKLDNAQVHWSTVHQYVGDTPQLRYSRMTYNDEQVADIYYPGFQTFDSALKEGVSLEAFESSLNSAGLFTTENKAGREELVRRFQRFCQLYSYSQSSSRRGFEELPDDLEDKLKERLVADGFSANTTLQTAVVVSFAGGISVAYRLPEDGLERLIMDDLGSSRTVSLDWEGRYTLLSMKLTPDNQIIGTYRTEHAPEKATDVLRPYLDVYLGYAASNLGHKAAPGSLFSRLLFQNRLAPNKESEALWQDYARYGVTPQGALTKVIFTPKALVLRDGQPSFSSQDGTHSQTYYVLPYDPLGNYIVESGGAASMGLWWMQGDKDLYLRLGRPKPAIDVSPGGVSVQQSVKGDFGELMLFRGRDDHDRDQDKKLYDRQNPQLAQLQPFILQIDLDMLSQWVAEGKLAPAVLNDINNLRSKKVEGYWYDLITESNYLRREFHLRDSGKPFLKQYDQVLTYPAQLLRWREKRIYLDTTAPYFKPLLATNETGKVVTVWKKSELTPDGGQIETVEINDPIFGEWHEAIEYTDANGFPVFHDVTKESLLWGFGVTLPVIIFICSWDWVARLWIKRWARFRNRPAQIRDVRQTRSPDQLVKPGRIRQFGVLYGEEIAQMAVERIANRVLARSDPSEPNCARIQRDSHKQVFTLDGIPEVGFLYHIYPIFALVLAWRRRNGASDTQLRGADPDETLDKLDAFTVSVARYTVEELSQGRSEQQARFANKQGTVDPYVWDKLFTYLQMIYMELRQESIKPAPSVSKVLSKYGILAGSFDASCGSPYKIFLAKSGWECLRHDWRDRVRRLIGWRTKSIHIYAGQEYADLFPLFLAVLLGTGVLFTNNVNLLLDTLRSGWVWGGALLALGISGLGVIAEWRHMSSGGMWIGERSFTWKILGHGLGLSSLALLGGIFLVPNPTANLGIWFLKVIAGGVALAEAWGHLAMRHSLVGLSIYYHFKPTIGRSRKRVICMVVLQALAFLATGLAVSYLTYSWWYGHYAAHLWPSLFGALAAVVITLYLIYHGLWSLLSAIAALYMAISDSTDEKTIKADTAHISETDGQIAIVYAGPPLASPVFAEFDSGLRKCYPAQEARKGILAATNQTTIGIVNQLKQNAVSKATAHYTTAIREFLDKSFGPILNHLELLQVTARAQGLEAELQLLDFVDKNVVDWLNVLHEMELKHEVTFLHRSQLEDFSLPQDIRFTDVSDVDRKKMVLALNLARFLTIMNRSGGAIDTGIHIMDIAECVHNDSMLKGRVVFVQTFNKYDRHQYSEDTPGERELGEYPAVQDEKIGRLFSSIAHQDEAHAVAYNWTNMPSKSGAMNAMMALHRIVPRMRVLHILDQNSNSLHLSKLMDDYKRILNDPDLVVLTAFRNTSNTTESIGRQNESIEGGHGATLVAVPDKIGTGWENLMSVYFWHVLAAMSHPEYPQMPLSGELCHFMRGELHPRDHRDWGYFGLAGFAPNGIGQSEDLWAVLHQTHNLIGLGGLPSFSVTRAPAIKLREHKRSFEILNAATRWAGGLIDTLRSPINQQISFFGPESIFERKVRRCSERFYLIAPFGVLSIAAIFVGIFFDMNPFVGVQVVFWSAAAFFNQVLTFQGLAASVRARGRPSLTGSIIAGAAVLLMTLQFTGRSPIGWLIALMLALLTAASPAGFSWWLVNRVRDVILLAPRYFMEASAVVVRLTGGDHAFAISRSQVPPDARGRAVLTFLRREKPANWYWPFVPLWLSVVMIGEAILFTSVSLDFSNIILMWLVLAFVGGALVGFFTEDSRPGKDHPRWGPASIILGIAWGISTVLSLHYVFIAPLFIALTAFGVILPAALGPLILAYKAVRTHQQRADTQLTVVQQRAISNFQRNSFKVMALCGWFGIVQVPDNVRLTIWPGRPLVATFEVALFYFLAILALVAIIAAIGEVHNLQQKRALWKDFKSKGYSHLAEALPRVTSGADNSLRVTKNNALAAHFLVKMGMGHWADARKTLDLIVPGTFIRGLSKESE